jgi:hypothetical protein
MKNLTKTLCPITPQRGSGWKRVGKENKINNLEPKLASRIFITLAQTCFKPQ